MELWSAPPILNRRRVLGAFGAAIATPFVGAELASASTNFPIVDSSGARAVIVVADNVDVQANSAAQSLRRCIALATGVELSVVKESLVGNDVQYRVHIGFTTDSTRGDVQRQLADLDDDGYAFVFTGNILTIIGPSSWGTRFGVYEFLERYVGVRWLMPGNDWEDIPTRSTLAIPRTPIRSQPAILSRQISPLGIGNTWDHANPQLRWAAHNRMHERMSYSHNLGVVFAPEKYADPTKPETFHPEYYPLKNGVVYLPKPGVRTGWQPRFTESSTVGVAVAAAVAAFDADPTRRAFALGINDNSGFSEEYYDLARVNRNGGYSVSDIYYQWINAVAEGVAAKYPNKFLGLLAYNEVVEPPSFRLHPIVVPYLTRDRYGWVDPRVRRSDMELHADWERVASSIGWWDYTWGSPYAVPRIYGSATRDAYRYAAAHRVPGVFTQADPNWGEGPKHWIFTKLLWNPERSADDLLTEWCLRAAGPDAADDLIAYFHAWEKYWTQDAPDLPWFRAGNQAIYYNWLDPSPVGPVTPELIAESRRRLESARDKTTTLIHRSRVSTLLRAFEYYEASALSYPRPTPQPIDTSTARELLDHTASTIDSSVGYAARRLALIDEFAADPLLKHVVDARRAGLVWSGWNLTTLWQIVEFVRGNESTAGPLRDHIAELAASSQSSEVRGYFGLLLRLVNGQTVQRAINPSFEDSTVEPWLVEFSHTPRLPATITNEFAVDGGTSLRVTGPSGGGISQRVTAEPGFFRASFSYFTPQHDAGQGTVVPTWFAYDAAGKSLQLYRGESRALADTRGRWAELAMAQMLPEGTASVRCYCSLLSLGRDTTLYIDNASFVQAQF